MFLFIPSLLAGLLLGFNNFLLGLISEQGISAAYIFALGAIVFTISYKIFQIC